MNDSKTDQSDRVEMIQELLTNIFKGLSKRQKLSKSEFMCKLIAQIENDQFFQHSDSDSGDEEVPDFESSSSDSEESSSIMKFQG